MTDGVVHAGIGRSLNLEWQREHIIAFLEGIYNREYTAKTSV
jgi:hypothetical protein